MKGILDMNKKKIQSVDDYIATFPVKTQQGLKKIRKVINQAAPQAEEVFAYGVPAVKLNGVLVCFAAFKNHIGFYPMPSGIKAFKKELSDYETAEGTVKFPIDKPTPFDLIEKIVKYRVKENMKKTK